MSKHTLHARGYEFTWDDADTSWSEERTLLDLYARVGDLRRLTTYEGVDPHEAWNAKVSKVQNLIIDWIIEQTKEQEQS